MMHGLAHAGAAEEADLAALSQVGLNQVDDLDAGLEHLERLWTGRLRGSGAGRWIG